jgi:hypothetical protein
MGVYLLTAAACCDFCGDRPFRFFHLPYFIIDPAIALYRGVYDEE